MKRILFFFPESPAAGDAGNKARALSLLRYFKEREITVDFVSLTGWVTTWDDKQIEHLKDTGLVDNIYILSFNPNKNRYWHYFFNYKIPTWFYNRKKNNHPDSIVTYYMRECFSKILQQTHYDYILINYIYWADLIKENAYLSRSKTVIDTHDFITPHHLDEPEFEVGPYIGEEIRRLNYFDEVWAISVDEFYLFSQLCKPQKVKLVPMMLPVPQIAHDIQKQFDILYVASDNPSNQESVTWFFSEVYPQLPQAISIIVIGRITNYFSDFPNVTKVLFAEDLSHYYNRAKVVICPMLQGTGVKIKVVEALAYGLPVVCTTRGIDGLPNKIRNGCMVADNAVLFAANIVRILEDDELYSNLSNAGHDLFIHSFSREKVKQILDESFD